MCRSKKHATEMRDEFEECGHSLALLIDLFTSDVQLTERGRLALSAYGKESMDRFEHAEELLRNYEAETVTS